MAKSFKLNRIIKGRGCDSMRWCFAHAWVCSTSIHAKCSVRWYLVHFYYYVKGNCIRANVTHIINSSQSEHHKGMPYPNHYFYQPFSRATRCTLVDFVCFRYPLLNRLAEHVIHNHRKSDCTIYLGVLALHNWKQKTRRNFWMRVRVSIGNFLANSAHFNYEHKNDARTEWGSGKESELWISI